MVPSTCASQVASGTALSVDVKTCHFAAAVSHMTAQGI